MVISIDDHPLALNLLLFVRHAWSIVPDVDVPVLDRAPNPGASAMPVSASRDEWTDRWQIAWQRAWDWYSIQEPDRTKHPTPEIMQDVLRPGQELHPLMPPLWTSEYEWEGLDREAFNQWQATLSPFPPRGSERKNVADLIPAWESGLDTVLVLPYAGYFARRMTRRHLAVSAVVRNAPDLYGRALREGALS